MKKYTTISLGAIGLVLLFWIMAYMFLNIIVIFGTPCSEGNGDYYDAEYGTSELSIIAVLMVLVTLFLLFYPWLKLFWSLMLNRPRRDYYALFVANGKISKFISVIFTVLCTASIVALFYLTDEEATRISNWNYTHALCL